MPGAPMHGGAGAPAGGADSGAGSSTPGDPTADGDAVSDAGAATGDAAQDRADAGAAQQADACPPGRYLICEDFEDTAPGEVPDGWSVHGDADAVFVSDEQARGGARSLRLGPIDFWERRIYRDASALGSAHWGRVHYRVQLPVPDAFVHSTMIALQGVGPQSGPAEFRVVDTVKAAADTPDVGSRHQFLYNVQPQGPEFGTGTSYDFQFDADWHCAEWYVDAGTQTYRFYLDGDEVLSIENGPGNLDGTDLPDAFSELRVGWNNYQQAPPGFTAFLDELALDDDRIGCD